MRKEYLKDIANQMCQTALDQFDQCSLDDCKDISEEDKNYILDHIKKESLKIKNRIIDDNIAGIYSSVELVDYCNGKELL